MTSRKIAVINEHWTAGATRCARDIEYYLAPEHTVRYYPRHPQEKLPSLLDDLRQFSPDVVNLHSFYSWLPYKFLSDISHRYPTCMTVHDPRPMGTITQVCWHCPHYQFCFRCALSTRFRKLLFLNPHFWQRLYKRAVYWYAADTVTFIAPSRWMQKRLRNTEIKRFQIHHIPYGVDLHHFSPIPDARSQLQLPLESPIILFVAHADVEWRAHPRKGLRFLAEAFADIIAPRQPETLLLVAGEHVVPNHPQVKPLGHIPLEKLPMYYSAANVFVIPSLVDNLPYTVLEAMACGAPVVGSSVGGIPEEIEDGVNGYLVPHSHPKDLGNAILAILQDQQKQIAMSRASRVRVEKFFSMETFTARYTKLFQRLATQ